MAAKWIEERKGKNCLVIDYASGSNNTNVTDPLYGGSAAYSKVLSSSLSAQYEAFSARDPV